MHERDDVGQQQGCRYVISEDLPHGQQIDSVQILNPFPVRPEVRGGRGE